MSILRLIHRWVGIFLGIQMILWMVSGFIMSFYDHDMVEGNHLRKPPVSSDLTLAPFEDLSQILSSLPAGEQIMNISAQYFRGQNIVKIRTNHVIRMFDAKSGEFINIDAGYAKTIAGDDFIGEGEITTVSEIMAPTLETRESSGPGWRVDFNNHENSSLYISSQTGQIWERRHDRWRRFDIFWMLHIMDYQNRTSFNNWIVILASWISLFIALSGIIVLFENLSKGDFNIFAPLLARNKTARFTVKSKDGSFNKSYSSKGRNTLFSVLASENINLPTSCGGGGTCGLCRVQLKPAPRALPADYRKLSREGLKEGYRLSCQHHQFDKATVSLPSSLFGKTRMVFKVE
jgi:Na+-transporting NADH:ubiquinone oxidoreductase subunit F